MRYFSALIFLLFTLALATTTQSQSVNFDDGFEDGDFTNNPAWSGDNSDFTVVDDDPNYLLQLDAASSPSYLSALSSNIEGYWQFYIEFRGFEPSGSNQAEIFLMSNIANLEGAVNGYAIQVGESGDDVFHLVRYDSGSETATVLSGTTVVQSGGGYTVRVTRDNNGNWQMQVGEGYGLTSATSQSATDNTHTTASYFGPKINFTSSRSDLFYLDFKIDLPPFTITNAQVTSTNAVDITFNRAPDQTTVDASDFTINNSIGSPLSISFPAPDTVQLNYDQELPSNKYSVSVNGISDQSGNSIQSGNQTFYVFDSYASGDVKINEFMSDPPSGQAEYVEVINTSNKYLNLAQWEVGDDGGTEALASNPIPLEPNGFRVISADTTTLFNIYGSRQYVLLSNLPSLNNGDDAVHLVTASGTQADSLFYTSEWDGNNVALERRSPSAPSIYSENWGNSPNPQGGTPGQPNEVASDNSSPELTNFSINSPQMLTLTYDERLNQAGNYAITNSSISSITQTAADTVELLLDSSLQNAQEYTLSISNVEDIFGNTIASSDTSFTFYNPSPVDSGDVAINEFMSAPPSNSSEYIEIYNHSDKSLDLQNWTFSDNRDQDITIATSSFVIPPDSFAVIAPDNSLKSDYPGIALVAIDGFPSLNNGGDQIVIRDSGGAVLDSLTYSSDWGEDEIAVVRRTIDVTGVYQSNWGPSPSGFGTPGRQNEITSDTKSPTVKSLTIQNSNTIALSFSEQLDESSAENTSNYSLASGLAISDATFASPNSVFLQLASDLQNATDYTMSVESVTDIFGNTVVPIDTTFTFYEISLVASGDVFINEFSFDPASGSTEFIEVYNPTSQSFNLQNWMLSDNRGNPTSITNSQYIVPPDSFVVVAPDNTLLSSHPDISLVAMSDFPSLNNSGDVIALRDRSGTLLDSLQYRADWGGTEVALERRTTSVSGMYSENWGNAPNGIGTPGSVNQVSADNQPPQLTTVAIESATTFKIGFDERLKSGPASDASNYSVSNTTISKVSQTSRDSVEITLDAAMQNSQEYTLTISNIQDIFANSISQADTTFTFYEVTPAAARDVFLNEFMYDPASGMVEYIELHNPTDKSLDLQNWTLNDNSGPKQIITDAQFIIPPDSFAVISADHTLLSNHPDIALVSIGNRFPSLNNSSDDIVIRSSDGTLLDSLRYTSAWGGNEVPLERRTTASASIYKENWGNAPSENGSPGRMNQIKADQSPPQLAGFKIIDSQQLNLIFDERIDGSLDNGNLSISGGISIDNASLLPPDTIAVALASKLQNATGYTISAQNIADIFGNQLAAADTSFTFYQVSPVDSGDVFINEFSFDPPSGSTEFIEIYNPTSQSFNLQNWMLSDNRGNPTSITNSQYIVPPDSFVVVAPDNTLLTDHPDISLVTMSNFPALNSSGDDIKIRNASGALLDSLRYTSAWGGNNLALERRTVSVAGTFAENWGDAPNGFGTPGAANEITADDTPPFFEELYAVDAITLQLVFSENITASSATDAQHYQISPGKNIQLISARNDSVTLFLGSELTSGNTYKVTATNIEDIFGNTLSGATKGFKFLKIDAARPGDIVINEILYNPGPDEQADFIEIYNTTSKNFELGNWTISDASRKAKLPQNVQLPANSYLVLTGDDRFASTVNNGLDVDDFPSYNNNSGDDVYLQTSSGRTIDSLHYETNWGGSTEGNSLERKDPLAASNDASNWQTSSTSSAGNQNISFQEDTSPPTVIFSKVLSNGQIEVRFDEFIQLTPDLKFFASDTPLQIATFDSTRGNVIFLSGGSSKSQKSMANSLTITVENLSDVKGNTTESTKVSIAQPMQPSNLVINEIMFNPLDDADDNRPDQSEYIELRNTQNYAVSLEGLYLHDAPDEDGNIRKLQPVLTTAKWVPPQGKVLIHADPAITFDNSKIANFFDLGTPDMQSVMRLDRSSLSLASTGDAIYIADSTGTTIDSVFYGESWHNPNIIDTRGVALERVSPTGPSDDESNWGSSVNPKGGTPNTENSIYQENTQQPQETGISFTPNPFSPDGDGHEDNLFINYKLDQQDYLIDVHIYDRYGRMVRELADGKRAGLQGQLIWNGRKDDGSRNRIGIYIVVFEAYDSTNGNKKTFKKTVVLARKLN